MRIKDKKTQTYDRFRYLLEFQVKKGPVAEQEEVPVEDEATGDVFGELGDALDGNKKPEEQSIDQSQMEQPIENKADVDIDVTDNQGFEDTASDLLKIHASKIDKLTNYINDSVKILQVLNQKTDEITSNVDQMNSKVGELNQRVDNQQVSNHISWFNKVSTSSFVLFKVTRLIVVKNFNCILYSIFCISKEVFL
jgi:hypothetical protein